MSSHARRAASAALNVMAAVCLTAGVLAWWTHTTVFDSETFSRRATSLLDSESVRREVAVRLTEELARGGNRQVVEFRPAAQLAVEAAVDTDTFRSIFRTAVRRTHAALLDNRSGGDTLDLSESLAILSASMQLASGGSSGEAEAGLGSSFGDVLQRVADFGVWRLEGAIAALALGGLVLAVLLAVGAIAVAPDRRRGVARLGLALLAAGVAVLLLVQVAEALVGRYVGDPSLAEAVRSAISQGTADLASIGFGVAAYGVVTFAAAQAARRDAGAVTPAGAVRTVSSWVEEQRDRTGWRVGAGIGMLVVGAALLWDPIFWLRAAGVLAGVWVTYLGILVLLGTVRRRAGAVVPTSAGSFRAAVVTVAAMLLLAVVAVVAVGASRRAAAQAEAGGERKCNGSAENCDRRLDEVTLLGSHNAMSASLYPGWLFAEQLDTLGGQLGAGVRALLVDTHYGVPSSARLPGAESPLVLTDVASEVASPLFEQPDPETAERAAALAARAPKRAGAIRDLYLCHNHCELGAIPFSSALGEVKRFLDTHPDEVVMLAIQDATSPDDTAAAIERAGLGDRVATLTAGEPLPTFGELVDSGRTLLVFAEQSGPDAPAWYHRMYDWFDETPYTFRSLDDFTCGPNRGGTGKPLFLVNHWVSVSPPDPGKARQANGDALLDRLATCAEERGRLPNVVAVDFAGRDRQAARVADVQDRLRSRAASSTTLPPEPATSPSPLPVSPPSTVALPDLPEPTRVTTVTGGDPTRFCAAVDELVDVLEVWVPTVLSQQGEAQGLAELVLAPHLTEALAAYRSSAPDELAALAAELDQRSQAGLTALRAVGADEVTTARLAASLRDGIAAGTDPLVLERRLVDDASASVDPDLLRRAATTFAAARRDPATALDLGDVDDALLASAGFDCAAG